ncbi:putative HTH-type transcriptional regulator [Zhongshania aliphaticivorans]|uniref:Putative HTH-type transcriptional regulator n=1 Tax=Zhongshania aliphaticivorans TaxID=1470434 RepID=A0A5S9NSM9_9GAMM|nr:AraC family transcriptional regulator [Zhongshania aliphaticivorans]CAA0093651.1 putative HTH-type transcriptional regulator [Zhongshania aliphaticivorans]CAA0111652.1 putative HTH-type transcriptional regulator [Zhongshania aliphaticivorans]
MSVPNQSAKLSSTPIRTVNGSAFKALFQAAEVLGADLAALCTDTGLSLDNIEDVDSRYPVDDLLNLYELVASQTQTPDIGLYLGRIDYINRLNLQLYACSACATFREYLNVMPSVLRIVGDIGEVKVRRDSEFIRLDWQPLAPETAQQRYLSDSSLAAAAVIVNSVCVRPIVIRAAHFSYPQPEDLSMLIQQFGVHLLFNQPNSCLYIDRACLDYALIRLDANWVQALAQPIRYLFEDNKGSNDFVVALRKTLLRLLPSGDMSIDKAAEALNISRRTLQRRLAEQGTQFLHVLQELRAELAIQYLSDERLSITDIAFLLGYMDQSSFSGAFRSWHGKSPRDFRKQ